MARPALMETLTRIAEPVATSMGMEIWGLEVLQAGCPMVRLYVDVPSDTAGGAQEAVSISQCADISRLVGLALDVEDVFALPYVLEVSSPGLSRAFFRLEQMRPYVGDTVEIVLNEASAAHWPGRKKFRGRLTAVTDDTLTLDVEADATGTEEPLLLTVHWDEVRKAARVHVFVDPEKPGHRKRASK